MDTFFTMMHHIDVENEKITYKSITNDDAQQYISQLTEEIFQNKTKRNYEITSPTTEVISQVIKVYKQHFVNEQDQDIIAKRLLNKEIEAQLKINHLNKEIKKGSLIQSFFQKKDVYFYLISKIESDEFLDGEDLHKRNGLRYDNKAFKNCLIQFDSENEISEILISDTNSGGTDYWHNLFLELKEITTDEVNTKKTFDLVENVLKREFKNSPPDLTLYRNQLVGYFQTQSGYSHEECVKYIFGDLEHPDIDVKKFQDTIEKKAEIKKTDSQFTIEKKAINKRKWKETRQVNEYVDITLKGHNEQIKNTIHSYEKNKEKYISIRVTDDETYDSFNWKK